MKYVVPVLLVACGGGGNGHPGPMADAAISDSALADGSIADAMARPDAYEWCPTLTNRCIDALNLETCTMVDHVPSYTQCNAGCIDAPQAHCGVIVPTGVVTTADIAPDPQLLAITISAPTTVNTDTGAITGVRDPGTGVIAGIDFEVRSGVGVFRFANLATTEDVTFTGSNAVALVSLDTIHVSAILDVQGDCLAGHAGPGGTPGSGTGSGAGGVGVAAAGTFPGGGGGGHGAHGGAGGSLGGPGGAAGPAFGDPEITVLRGGGGGGAGAGANGGVGGGGGGAIQLVAHNEIVFAGSSSSFAGVFAGGCGGRHGTQGSAGGGGGGAGGAILMEAPYIDTGFDYVGHDVSGGGGGASDGVVLADGQNGSEGGRGGTPGGGNGGWREFNGHTIVGGDAGGGAGGGGGVGRIRFNYVNGIRITSPSDTTPNTDDAITTATLGMAAVE